MNGIRILLIQSCVYFFENLFFIGIEFYYQNLYNSNCHLKKYSEIGGISFYISVVSHGCAKGRLSLLLKYIMEIHESSSNILNL